VLHVVAFKGAFKFFSFSGVFCEDCLSEASSAAAGETEKFATGHNMKHPGGPIYWHNSLINELKNLNNQLI